MINKIIEINHKYDFPNYIFKLNPTIYSMTRDHICWNIRVHIFIINRVLEYNLFNNNDLQQYKANL